MLLLSFFDTPLGNDEDTDVALDFFLFSYSPEVSIFACSRRKLKLQHAFSLVQENAEALKDAIFLDIVMGKVKDVYEPEIFLETLNVLSSIGVHFRVSFDVVLDVVHAFRWIRAIHRGSWRSQGHIHYDESRHSQWSFSGIFL